MKKAFLLFHRLIWIILLIYFSPRPIAGLVLVFSILAEMRGGLTKEMLMNDFWITGKCSILTGKGSLNQ